MPFCIRELSIQLGPLFRPYQLPRGHGLSRRKFRTYYLLVFNYSTNIRKISDIKKSRGNYFAFILHYYPTSILPNSDWVALGPAAFGSPMALTARLAGTYGIGREHTSLYYSWILAFVSADLLGSF